MRQLLWIVFVNLAAGRVLAAGYTNEWERMKRMELRGYLCVQVKKPINIDGRLSDASWQKAPWTEDFVDIEGPAKPAPLFRTRAKMVWDERYFYIGAELLEPHVWGTLTKRDAVIFQDPDFEVFIDPDGDSHQYYEFEMNALNTGWDLRLVKAYKDGGPALNEWDIPGLQTAVHVDGTLNHPGDVDRSWTVEIAIPWTVMAEYSRQACPPKNRDRWRINFSRVEWKITTDGGYRKVPNTPEDNWVWSPTGIIDMHRPEKWGLVEFTTSTTARRKVRPGRLEAARDQLQEVYYAERSYQKATGRFIDQLSELGLGDHARSVKLQLTDAGWCAKVDLREGGGRRQACIRQDGYFWVE